MPTPLSIFCNPILYTEYISISCQLSIFLCFLPHVLSPFLFRGVDPEGKEFSRPYTPTSLDSDIGYVELVIKVSEPSSHKNVRHDKKAVHLTERHFTKRHLNCMLASQGLH